MFKRVTIVALLVAAFVLLVAVPAMAFNGYRSTYTTSDACATCHNGIAGIPAVYKGWAATKHGTDEVYEEDRTALPYGSVCMGCHSSNFNPSKEGYTPIPVATDADGKVSWEMTPSSVDPAQQSTGSSAWSEGNIGCSSCHYGARTTGGGLAVYGDDPNDSAHTVPMGNMADAQICGACHSRYSYTVGTYTVAPVPYLTVTGGAPEPAVSPTTIVGGTPVTPNPSPTTLIQPQMAIGYPMLGAPSPAPAWSPNLAAYLNVQQPGWKPSPTATSAAGLMTYWQTPIPDATVAPFYADTKWQFKGHDGSAAQYPEWASEGHANSLKALTSQPFWASFPEATKQQCLECHSADYRILKEMGESPTSADVKYGITCVGCHTPHDAGTVTGVWDEEFDAQLRGDADLDGNGSNVCVECHNGELPEGTTASPGAEIHHPMKEMMDGYGAIDVASFPSVHKGKCIQCHMPPTSISRGAVQKGGNHTFEIITPEVAAEAKAKTNPASGTWTQEGMPYSACTTCHARTYQNGYGEEIVDSQALWLQDTIDQRQEWTETKVDEIWAVLDQVAVDNGYADASAARDVLVEKPQNTWTTTVRAFLNSFTNVEFVQSEGSFGLHNWDYSREIVNVALMQAKIAESGVLVKMPYKVTFKLSKTSIKAGSKVTFSGKVKTAKGVAAAGTVKIMKRVKGVWKVWQRAKLSSTGSYKLTKKMTSKGKFYLRGFMPADSLNLSGHSKQIKLVVK